MSRRERAHGYWTRIYRGNKKARWKRAAAAQTRRSEFCEVEKRPPFYPPFFLRRFAKKKQKKKQKVTNAPLLHTLPHTASLSGIHLPPENRCVSRDGDASARSPLPRCLSVHCASHGAKKTKKKLEQKETLFWFSFFSSRTFHDTTHHPNLLSAALFADTALGTSRNAPLRVNTHAPT